MSTVLTKVRTDRGRTYSGQSSLVGRTERIRGGICLVTGDGHPVRLTGDVGNLADVSGRVLVEGIVTWEVATNTAVSIRVQNWQTIIPATRPFAALTRKIGDHWRHDTALGHLQRIRGTE